VLVRPFLHRSRAARGALLPLDKSTGKTALAVLAGDGIIRRSHAAGIEEILVLALGRPAKEFEWADPLVSAWMRLLL
jgi:hypothetical protein